MFRGILLAATALALMPAAANAQSFYDDFNGEGGSGSDLNYAAFANFGVTGQVDLVQSPEFGILCDGKCVDLDGTRGPGTLLSNAIAFTAGQAVKISFDLSGSQRSGDSDDFSFAALFTDPTDIASLTSLTGFAGAPLSYGASNGFVSFAYATSIAGNAGFTTYSLWFRPLESGTLRLSFGTTSADNVGPLLDNVSVVAVPEPAAWGMMIGGFGLAGMAMRRRSTKTKISFA